MAAAAVPDVVGKSADDYDVQEVPAVQRSEYGVRCPEYGVRCPEYGVRCAEYKVPSTKYGVRCPECSVQEEPAGRAAEAATAGEKTVEPAGSATEPAAAGKMAVEPAGSAAQAAGEAEEKVLGCYAEAFPCTWSTYRAECEAAGAARAGLVVPKPVMPARQGGSPALRDARRFSGQCPDEGCRAPVGAPATKKKKKKKRSPDEPTADAAAVWQGRGTVHETGGSASVPAGESSHQMLQLWRDLNAAILKDPAAIPQDPHKYPSPLESALWDAMLRASFLERALREPEYARRLLDDGGMASGALALQDLLRLQICTC